MLVTGAALALAEETAGIEPAGERATAAKPEALVPWAKDKAVGGREMAPQEMQMPTEGERGPAQLLQNALLKDGERKPKVLPPKGKHIMMPEVLLLRESARR